jgi:hypothetical protein
VDVALSSSMCDGGYEPSHARCLNVPFIYSQENITLASTLRSRRYKPRRLLATTVGNVFVIIHLLEPSPFSGMSQIKVRVS